MRGLREFHPMHAVSRVGGRHGVPLVLLAFAALACGGPAKGPETAPAPGEWRTFHGTLNTTGHGQTLRLGPDRKCGIFSLSGSLLLVGERRLGVGFQCRAIGFSDSAKGLVGWGVWTDARGDQIFSEIRGEPIGARRRISGTLLGGTGTYAGITGEYEFVWQLVVGDESADEGGFQGRADEIRGRFRMTAPSPASPPNRSSAPESRGNRP